MNYAFDDFELDTARLELRRNGVAIAIEPQVFSLLRLLVENRDRVVSKDEIVSRVWDGRVVSESAVSSRIKSARRALGDDGSTQRMIRTVHGTGFRFVCEAEEMPESVRVCDRAAPLPAPEGERPSIAVIPFRLVGAADPESAIAEALPQDLITELSRLRWLFVIARASTFRFRGENLDIDRVRSDLNVRYCLCGSIEILGARMAVSVELCDTHDKGVVWSDRFEVPIGAVHEIRQEIVRAVINALELQIPLNEARRARLKSPGHLDAWSAYHLALQHMYRFNKTDNAVATGLFERARTLDPGFARAYAGLSFTHFQDAFLGYSGDTARSAGSAEQCALQSLERDSADPFGNLCMGRSFLLRSDLDGALPWLDRANTLNPNYAQAKYSRAWTESLLTQVAPSRTDIDNALALSPLDPLRYAMLAVRAFSHMVLDERAKAAEWAERAARSPGAHVYIELIAAVAHGLNGDGAQARAWMASARKCNPSIAGSDFLRAFPFRDPATRARVDKTLERLGF